jgi:hypothetical protein
MNTNRDQLDEAIDQVAARLTHMTEDEGLALRIVNQLPERATWLGWLFHSWAPRLAVGVLAVGTALVVLRTFDDRSPDVLRTENAGLPTVVASPIVEPAPDVRRTIAEPSQIVRRTIVERPQNDRRTLDAPDFERSLPPIAAVRALEFDSLAPVSLPEDAPLTVAPLAIADLPLTAESDFPR